MIALYIFLGIIALTLITGMFTKKEYSISREIEIDKPASTIYSYLNDFRNHQYFNAWLKKDTNIKIKYNGILGKKGYTLIYEGDKEVGAGEQELIGFEENKWIDIELRFFKPFKSTSTTPFTIERITDSVSTVRWVMNGKMNYPMNIILWFANMDSFLGNDIQKSLSDLKIVLENK